MKLCIYHAPSDVHPNACSDDYDILWPAFLERAHKFDYEVIHLTDKTDKARGDVTLRFPVDPRLSMFSREVCWLGLLRDHAKDGETYCLTEPDAWLQHAIPELGKEFDLALLHRPFANIPPGFRIARRTTVAFFESLVGFYDKLPEEKKRWHGDVDSIHWAVKQDHGLKIDWRPSSHYGIDRNDRRSQAAVMLNFCGESKVDYLKWLKARSARSCTR